MGLAGAKRGVMGAQVPVPDQFTCSRQAIDPTTEVRESRQAEAANASRAGHADYAPSADALRPGPSDAERPDLSVIAGPATANR